MKIAVTGSNGSVGRRIVLLALKNGHNVVGIDRNLPLDSSHADGGSLEFIQLDVRDFDGTMAALRGCDGVVHLAAHPTPTDYLVKSHNDNVVMSWNVLRACAELGITRIAQASSVNVIPLAWTTKHHYEYFPLDEDHPCLPDEPYGLSKLIAEIQADTVVRRFTSIRIASLRFSWSLPTRDLAAQRSEVNAKRDLWGWVQEDAVARAALLAITNDGWNGHERFFIVAPDIAPIDEDSEALRLKHWPEVRVRDGYDLRGRKGFYDCSKAERLLGWFHDEELAS